VTVATTSTSGQLLFLRTMAKQTALAGLMIWLIGLVLISPITLMYIGCLYIILGSTGFYSFNHLVSFSGLVWTGFVVFSGYGLASLWWLLFRFRCIYFKQIPFAIKLGLFFGALVSISFSLIVKPISAAYAAPFVYIFGAPLLLTFLLLFITFKKH
jgi:hypothetical protein